ncbi:MAG: geranylgeranylglyceryl/heptaprenylglyceryl phosphate synthase [Calditrichaeota bacterium]|nr:MAG: geranylgeranylglyceryl/heptaprenylglyceryl phosphate synthase [Calditrichota bacterium]
MQNDSIFQYLIDKKEKRGGGFLVLIDPDKSSGNNYLELAESAMECGVDALLVGTSFMLNTNFSDIVREIKEKSDVPVIIFPGSFAQITPHADAILFSSLISGRNPAYLIDEQVKGAPIVKRCNIEPIPTAYMLIESGPQTSVQFISGTNPIPRDKYDIACAHALAAEYMGMKLAYLEAGSGAKYPVPVEMIQAVASYTNIPIITGGGLTSPEACTERIDAGASFIVVGNILEKELSLEKLYEFSQAVHTKESIPA